jgi:hypothetical protein
MLAMALVLAADAGGRLSSWINTSWAAAAIAASGDALALAVGTAS